MEKQMSGRKIPKTDSIEELARFWDMHDVTDFEDQLEEVTEPVFECITVRVHLQPKEIEAVQEIAKSKGIDSSGLIRQWVLDKIQVS
jgi:CopG antitoxin of type II toxin-antitoxin system